MRQAEQKVWDAMKRGAKKVPALWLQRVENIAGDGMPDVHAAHDAIESWVELKAAKMPARSTTKLQMSEGLRQSQINWHLKAQSKGLRTYILVRIEGMEREPMLINGSWAKEFNDYIYADAVAASVARGWPDIFEELMP